MTAEESMANGQYHTPAPVAIADTVCKLSPITVARSPFFATSVVRVRSASSVSASTVKSIRSSKSLIADASSPADSSAATIRSLVSSSLKFFASILSIHTAIWDLLSAMLWGSTCAMAYHNFDAFCTGFELRDFSSYRSVRASYYREASVVFEILSRGLIFPSDQNSQIFTLARNLRGGKNGRR